MIYSLSQISLTYSYLQNALCAVNVQHNCALNKCTVENTRQTRQEREVIEQLSLETNHRNKDDLILNTAQMRSSVYVGRFRVQAPIIDCELAVMTAVKEEIDKRKRQQQVNAGVAITSPVQ